MQQLLGIDATGNGRLRLPVNVMKLHRFTAVCGAPGKRPFVGGPVQQLLGMVATGNGRLMRVAGKRPSVGLPGAAAPGRGGHRRADPDCQRPFDEGGQKRPSVGGPVQELLGIIPTGHGRF